MTDTLLKKLNYKQQKEVLMLHPPESFLPVIDTLKATSRVHDDVSKIEHIKKITRRESFALTEEAMWILATGVIYLLSSRLGGRGRFDALFSMTGYSLWAPWYPLIIVDCIQSTPE